MEIGELSMAMKCIASISGMALGYHEDILGKNLEHYWDIILPQREYMDINYL